MFTNCQTLSEHLINISYYYSHFTHKETGAQKVYLICLESHKGSGWVELWIQCRVHTLNYYAKRLGLVPGSASYVVWPPGQISAYFWASAVSFV